MAPFKLDATFRLRPTQPDCRNHGFGAEPLPGPIAMAESVDEAAAPVDGQHRRARSSWQSLPLPGATQITSNDRPAPASSSVN